MKAFILRYLIIWLFLNYGTSLIATDPQRNPSWKDFKPELSLNFALKTDALETGLGCRMLLKNISQQEFHNWDISQSALGLVRIQLQRRGKLSDDILFSAPFRPLLVTPKIAIDSTVPFPIYSSHTSNNTLDRGGLLLVGCYISISKVKSSIGEPLGTNGFEEPFAIREDGDYRIIFLPENLKTPFCSAEFSVHGIKEDKPILIIEAINQ